MRNRTLKGALLCALAFTLCAAASAQEAEAARQQSQQGGAARAEVNHEVQLHLLVTAEGAEGAGRVPQSLEGVVRQLKASLPQSEYRLAATFINRIRDGGSFELRTVAGTLVGAGAGPNQLPPGTFQISLSGVRLVDAATSQSSVNIQQFRFGMKVPLPTGQTAAAADKSGSYPVFQYEDAGVNTQLNVREGEPTLVSTLNTSRPGQLFAIVITVRRTR